MPRLALCTARITAHACPGDARGGRAAGGGGAWQLGLALRIMRKAGAGFEGLDLSNAFNTLHPAAVLESVAAHAPHLLPSPRRSSYGADGGVRGPPVRGVGHATGRPRTPGQISRAAPWWLVNFVLIIQLSESHSAKIHRIRCPRPCPVCAAIS